MDQEAPHGIAFDSFPRHFPDRDNGGVHGADADYVKIQHLVSGIEPHRHEHLALERPQISPQCFDSILRR